MATTNRICIRLMSSAAPCPFLSQNLTLQGARNSLLRHSKGIGSFEDDTSDLDLICQGCSKYFAPIGTYLARPQERELMCCR